MKRFFKHPVMAMSVLLIIAAGGYYAMQKKNAHRPEDRYKLATIERGDVTQSVSANGTLNPVTVVNVGTQVSGTVRRLYVDFNDRVEQGQILLELDDALLSAQAKQSEANVSNATSALELADANERRARALFQKEYISQQDLDQAVQARKSARAQLEQARAQHEKDIANLGYTVIRSPVSGVVVDRVVDLGQTVAASFQTPTLIKIAQDLAKMQIDSSFAEADIGNIRVGQTARFSTDAFQSRSFEGKVKQVRLNPTTQQSVVTYDVVITVDNPEQILLPGMTAYVNIAVAQHKGVLLVPNAALRFKPADSGAAENQMQPANGEEKKKNRKRDAFAGTVYVMEGGQLKPVSVTLGISDNRNTEVEGGELKAGDRVIIGEAQSAAESKAASSGPARMRLF